MDIKDLLYDFGGKVKANTMQGMVAKRVPTANMRRATAVTAEWFQSPLKATDLVERLRLLYKVGMTSFIH